MKTLSRWHGGFGLNPKTLHVSPQFHVASDDQFKNVPYLATGDIPPTWNKIVEKSERI